MKQWASTGWVLGRGNRSDRGTDGGGTRTQIKVRARFTFITPRWARLRRAFWAPRPRPGATAKSSRRASWWITRARRFLEVTTKNFAEGARFDLNPPIDIDSYLAKGFVRFRLKFALDGSAPGAMGQPGFPGGGEFPGGMAGGGGFPGGGMAGGGAGGRGGRRGDFKLQPPAALQAQTPAEWAAHAQFGGPGALPPLGGGPRRAGRRLSRRRLSGRCARWLPRRRGRPGSSGGAAAPEHRDQRVARDSGARERRDGGPHSD